MFNEIAISHYQHHRRGGEGEQEALLLLLHFDFKLFVYKENHIHTHTQHTHTRTHISAYIFFAHSLLHKLLAFVYYILF